MKSVVQDAGGARKRKWLVDRRRAGGFAGWTMDLSDVPGAGARGGRIEEAPQSGAVALEVGHRGGARQWDRQEEAQGQPYLFSVYYPVFFFLAFIAFLSPCDLSSQSAMRQSPTKWESWELPRFKQQ